MRIGHRFCLLALVVALALPLGWLSSAPAPRPRPAKGAPPRPIEAAFDDIRRGMAPKDLFALMAPYQKSCTEHYQWQRWTAGQFEVAVTIWPDGDLLEAMLAGRQFRVQEKSLYKVVVNGTERRLVEVRGHWSP
jgi:hypothetical protein